MLSKYFKINYLIILIVILLVEIVFSFSLKEYILNDKFLYNSFAEQMTMEEVENAVTSVKESFWLLLLSAVLKVIAEIFLITLAINLGTLLFEYQITFKQIFGAVTKAYIIFAITRVVLMGIYAYEGVSSLEDLNYIPKLSLFELFDTQSLPNWAVFPLQIANLPQLFFILLTALALNQIRQYGFAKWLLVVLGTYGTGLVIWTILVTFLVIL
ncbi:hypothetical protein P1X15_21025 [Runella sp. MFBS21]|uniref:hypothetical protein n=1 Tax=Runella sp. MFBS21 TaxID=3034018 RepID=UPI0023FA27AD|nr:hypothetical protein [Runella sp. MFBS21]MDF7820115.1 hypothetical protein [Runella sp. MFBS21]